MGLEKQKLNFLLTVFFSNSVFAAFSQRGKIERDGKKRGVYKLIPQSASNQERKDYEVRKSEFKKYLQKFLEILKDKKRLSAEDLEKCMSKLKEEVDRDKKDGGFSDILNEDNAKQITFGTVQKLVNLYLKYLWCANQIDFIPPHCPVDRQVLKAVEWTGKPWPKMGKTDYQRAIEQITQKIVGRSESIAGWELENWPFSK